jgi:hypothetical protein
VKAIPSELPAFDRHRAEYLSDEAFRILQATLMASPDAGDAIESTGGLRKLRLLMRDAARANARPAGDLLLVGSWVEVLALHPLRQG